MPRNVDRRQGRDGAAKFPQTLSLPIIPSSSSSGSLPRPSAPSRPTSAPDSRPRSRAVPPPALLPSPDAWEDDFTHMPVEAWEDNDTLAPRTTSRPSHALMPMSASGLSRNSMKQRAIVTPPVRLGPAPRPLRRTLTWQMILLVVAVMAIFATVHQVTPPASAYASAFQARAGARPKLRIVDQVPIQTQLDPTIGYDSPQQYKDYSLAACGAAATSSVLLAWGDPMGHIGQVIDDMKPYIQTIGMVDPLHGFAQVAQRHNFNALITNNITAAQLAYIVQTMGIPVVVGIRDTNGGYYQNFDVGHFLVIVGADPNGFQVVDNSTYFVHYFPTATFLSLWDAPRATIYTPVDYNFQMP